MNRTRVFFPSQFISRVISRKNYGAGCYAFAVPLRLTKPEIRNYFEKIYGVKVLRVNTNIVGKRTYWEINNRGRKLPKQTKQWKKAIIQIDEAFTPSEGIQEAEVVTKK
eukprot:TRINITY_DN7118_c0_g1_i1.p1 TRINITY_DN7118_c0_g1~~TRINITY_DN7118_c0_g1_i1.p1  ORF type:complete len:109 (+),score=19.12 TRINITY_DN7118_c0_g1_i1:2-328(+)